MEKARMNIRLPQDIKDFIEKGASIMGMSVTDFLVASATEKAEQTVEKHRSFLSSKRDQEIFFEALMNAAEPNENLKNAAARYKQITAESGDA
jgi:uncharacterized protein (DUF1778 family)